METGARRSGRAEAMRRPNRASEPRALVCRRSLPRPSIGRWRSPAHGGPMTRAMPTGAMPQTPVPLPGASPTSTAPTAASASATFKARSRRTATVCRATAAWTRTVDLSVSARRTPRPAAAGDTSIRRAISVALEPTCAAATAPTRSSSRAGAPTTEAGSSWRADRTAATDPRPREPPAIRGPMLHCRAPAIVRWHSTWSPSRTASTEARTPFAP